MALVTYPLNNLDYSAEDAELFHCTRSSGIYANEDFDYSVTGADNTITLGVGLAWLRNSRFSGKVAALKEALALDLGVPDAVYPRIDAVVIQFDANKNSTEIVVKQGTAASSPAAPDVSRTEVLYELHLYHVRREAGAAAVTVSNVTDLRLDPNYCGLMADPVTQIDTDAIAAQARALIEELHAELVAARDDSLYLLRGSTTPADVGAQTSSVTAVLSAASWTADEAAGYAQSIEVSGLTDEKKAKVYPAWPDTLADKLALSEETAKVRACSRSGSTMTFECWEDVPTLDIPIVVEVYV